jgi:hypothetical protein
MSCNTQRSLIEAWFGATAQFSDAVKAMTGSQIAAMSPDDFAVLRGKAETARLASENARLMLELHRKEHGC